MTNPFLKPASLLWFFLPDLFLKSVRAIYPLTPTWKKGENWPSADPETAVFAINWN